MSTPIFVVDNTLLAQATPRKATPRPAVRTSPATQAKPVAESQSGGSPIWMFASLGLLLAVAGLAVYGKMQITKLNKKVKFEEFRSRELQKKLKLALDTIRKMETNPDLVHSREFNLDYLRLRMDEEMFNSAIVNQIKIKVKELITIALRPTQSEQGAVGIATTSGRQVDETFDVTHETGEGANRSKRVLFRIQIKLMRLPTQPTTATINEIIACMEKYVGPIDENDTWQPTIQGRLVKLHWDQKAKPTPLLVLEQLSEGGNVTIRTKRGAVE